MTMIDRLVHQGRFLPVLAVVTSLIVIWVCRRGLPQQHAAD